MQFIEDPLNEARMFRTNAMAPLISARDDLVAYTAVVFHYPLRTHVDDKMVAAIDACVSTIFEAMDTVPTEQLKKRADKLQELHDGFDDPEDEADAHLSALNTRTRLLRAKLATEVRLLMTAAHDEMRAVIQLAINANAALGNLDRHDLLDNLMLKLSNLVLTVTQSLG